MSSLFLPMPLPNGICPQFSPLHQFSDQLFQGTYDLNSPDHELLALICRSLCNSVIYLTFFSCFYSTPPSCFLRLSVNIFLCEMVTNPIDLSAAPTLAEIQATAYIGLFAAGLVLHWIVCFHKAFSGSLMSLFYALLPCLIETQKYILWKTNEAGLVSHIKKLPKKEQKAVVNLLRNPISFQENPAYKHLKGFFIIETALAAITALIHIQTPLSPNLQQRASAAMLSIRSVVFLLNPGAKLFCCLLSQSNSKPRPKSLQDPPPPPTAPPMEPQPDFPSYTSPPYPPQMYPSPYTAAPFPPPQMNPPFPYPPHPPSYASIFGSPAGQPTNSSFNHQKEDTFLNTP